MIDRAEIMMKHSGAFSSSSVYLNKAQVQSCIDYYKASEKLKNNCIYTVRDIPRHSKSGIILSSNIRSLDDYCGYIVALGPEAKKRGYRLGDKIRYRQSSADETFERNIGTFDADDNYGDIIKVKVSLIFSSDVISYVFENDVMEVK